MIYPSFYRSEQLKNLYFNGVVPHFPIKRRAKIIGRYEYAIKQGDDILTLAKRIFGEDYPFYWTLISEINPLRRPDDWVVGETIFLPKIVVLNKENNLTQFSDAEITSTSI